jgi:hypothetical protein
MPDYKATIERAALIQIEAFDWNCPQQHIPPLHRSRDRRCARADAGRDGCLGAGE